ncbi:MAG: hypothetical protein ACTHJW_08910 [Streptosporangiaceae bacterium]
MRIDRPGRAFGSPDRPKRCPGIPAADLPTAVQFSFYGSAFVLGTEDFPLEQMIAKAETGRYKAKPASLSLQTLTGTL